MVYIICDSLNDLGKTYGCNIQNAGTKIISLVSRCLPCFINRTRKFISGMSKVMVVPNRLRNKQTTWQWKMSKKKHKKWLCVFQRKLELCLFRRTLNHVLNKVWCSHKVFMIGNCWWNHLGKREKQNDIRILKKSIYVLTINQI